MGAMLLADLERRCCGSSATTMCSSAPTASALQSPDEEPADTKLNLKKPEGIETALRIIDRSDALIEDFVPESWKGWACRLRNAGPQFQLV